MAEIKLGIQPTWRRVMVMMSMTSLHLMYVRNVCYIR